MIFTSPARSRAPLALFVLVLIVSPVTVSKGQDDTRVAKPDEGSLAPRAPLPPPGFIRSCLGLIERGRYDEARRLLEPVVSDHPGWARAHLVLALTYHKENRYDLARQWFERALEIDPTYNEARFFYGWCLYYLGELDRSSVMFESFLAVKPGYADAIFALGLIEFDADDVESARARFAKAIELSAASGDTSTEAKSRARLADVFVRTGDLERARAELERSLELNPDNYEAYFKLSRVLDRLGDAKGAEKARQLHRQVRERIRPGSTNVPPAEEP